MKSKRVLALLLALGMTISAAACGNGGNDSKENEGSKAESEQTAGEESIEDGNEVIDMDEEPYTVAIQVVTLPGSSFEGEEEREAAINAITVPAINCKVDIQEVWISEVAQTTSMAAAGNEKLDLIHVATVQNLSSMVGSDILYDMNEDNLLSTRGKGLIELFGEEMIAVGEVNGKQLAVPAQLYSTGGKGVYYNKTFADTHGIIVPETCTLEELTEVLSQVKAADPDMMPFFTGSGERSLLTWLEKVTMFGEEASYGAIIDENNRLVVENLYESDLYKDYILTMQKWTAMGLQPGDPTDTNSSQTYFQANKLFCVTSNFDMRLKAQYASTNPDVEIGWIEMVEPELTNGGLSSYMWGIASNSERPDKAMDFLNFLYTNGDVANILTYGLEGDNYEYAEGSDKVIVSNGTYTPNFFRGGNDRLMKIQHPNPEDYIENCEAFEASATVSPILAYMFDDTDYQTESSVIYSTILEYIPRLNNGMCSSEEETLALLEEFNAKLKQSGIEDVVAGNQAQLDSFLAGQ